MSHSAPPNIVVILADDLGFSDLGCYGGEIPTPNLDRLAARGVRMSAFYTTPRCSPTRASLLTGRYSHEVGIGVLTRPVGYRGSLDPEVPTLATLLSERGYATGLSGKWHLAANIAEPTPSWPTRRGFEDYYGILTGSTSYFRPGSLTSGEDPLQVEAHEDFYLTDALTAHALDFVRSAQHEQRPFFLYLAYTAPHWPLHAREDEIARHRDRYADGWDAAREARRARQTELGLFPHPFEPAPRDEDEPAWDDAPEQEWQQRRMEVYAAQVATMDRGIGELLDHLEASGAAENTLILFLSDNGAEAQELSAAHRLPPHVMPETTRAGEPVRVGNVPEVDPGPEASFLSYGRAWANLSNTPFRLYKKWVHEGGIAAPLIASWPGGLPEGEIHHEPQHVIDILPTVLDVVGAEAPAEVAGESFLPALRGEGSGSPRPLFWEHVGNAAVRKGRHKLVRETNRPWELYDVETDRAEQHDVAAQNPELVAALAEEWQQWADAHGVIPWQRITELYQELGLPAWQAQS